MHDKDFVYSMCSVVSLTSKSRSGGVSSSITLSFSVFKKPKGHVCFQNIYDIYICMNSHMNAHVTVTQIFLLVI